MSKTLENDAVQDKITKIGKWILKCENKNDGGQDIIIEELNTVEAKNLNLPCDSDESTLLHLAAMQNLVEVANYIIAKIPDLNNKDTDGETALHVAIAYDSLQIIESLIAAGADRNIQNNNGDTPLHTAIETGNLEVMELLAIKGADLNLKEEIDGDTPLHAAINKSNFDAVKFLVLHDAKTDLIDNGKRTPLDLAKVNYQKAMAELNLLDKTGGIQLDLTKVSDEKNIVDFLTAYQYQSDDTTLIGEEMHTE